MLFEFCESIEREGAERHRCCCVLICWSEKVAVQFSELVTCDRDMMRMVQNLTQFHWRGFAAAFKTPHSLVISRV